MSNQGFSPAFSYRFRDSLKAAGIFLAVMAIIYLLFLTGFAIFSSNGFIVESGTFSAFGFASTVMVFVLGICTIRDDLRVCIQHGVGRRSAFLANVAAAALIASILAVIGEFFGAIGESYSKYTEALVVTDLYGLLFQNCQALSAGQHLLSGLYNFSLLCAAGAFGTLLSMCFYRLPKAGKIALAIALPTLGLNGLPIFAARFLNLGAIFSFFMRSVFYIIALNLVIAALLLVFNWLLIRRAPINAAKR